VKKKPGKSMSVDSNISMVTYNLWGVENQIYKMKYHNNIT
jgi:hypothetical protein